MKGVLFVYSSLKALKNPQTIWGFSYTKKQGFLLAFA